jgi:hypothetical protein
MIPRFAIEDDHAEGAVGLARFDVQVSDDIRLNNVMLRRNGHGGYRICPPSAFGSRAFAVSTPIWHAIGRAAIERYESETGCRARVAIPGP